MAATGERQRLESGLGALGLNADAGQVDRLLAYLAELRRWNASYNLVAAGELPKLVSRHLLDSLAVTPWLRGPAVLDVGSGAGFPGLPLAVLNPGWRFSLLDSAGKKVRFLRHVVRTLDLDNVTPVESRVESFSPGGEFSTIVSRAFAALPAFLAATRHLAGPGTRWLAMLARPPGRQADELPGWVRIDEVAPLTVPGLDAERHIVVLSPRTQ